MPAANKKNKKNSIYQTNLQTNLAQDSARQRTWTFCLFRPDPPKSTDPPAADVAPAVAAPPVATPEIEIEMGEAPRAKFDPQTGKPIPKFDPQTGKQNW